MNLIFKALMIISFIISVMSCKLYDKLLDIAEESLEREEVSLESSNNKDTDAITDVQDSGRSVRKARSVDENGRSNKEEIVIGKSDHSGNGTEKIISVSEEARGTLDPLNDRSKKVVVIDEALIGLGNEAIGIYSEAESQLKEVDIISDELSQIKLTLDTMKVKIDNASSDLKKARGTPNKSADNTEKQILAQLDKAIKKVDSSRNRAEKINYNDAKNAMEDAKDNFKRANRDVEDALKAIRSNDSGWYWQYYPKAKEALNKANSMLECARRDQAALDLQMNQVEMDFNALEYAYDLFKKRSK